jgi:hypothetical protein
LVESGSTGRDLLEFEFREGGLLELEQDKTVVDCDCIWGASNNTVYAACINCQFKRDESECMSGWGLDSMLL